MDSPASHSAKRNTVSDKLVHDQDGEIYFVPRLPRLRGRIWETQADLITFFCFLFLDFGFFKSTFTV